MQNILVSAILLLALCSAAAADPTQPPAPYGAIPSHRQIEHSKLETYAFLHFTVNTFTDREWGQGDEDENVFNPTDFKSDQIVLAIKAAGLKGIVLTCKHHDGFCLWPTKSTDHNISHSSWKHGKGDVVKAISEACKRHGLKFGIYVSPWDRNNAHYGKPEYIDIYRQQLTELLTRYGPIFEVWHDGANGGSGYYGGAGETREIDRKSYYHWPETWDMIRRLQPGANVFSDIGPDLRWVGNESGFAPETSWATYDPIGQNGEPAAPGYLQDQFNGEGTLNGTKWLPAECDVSIRPGWFWHEAENDKVKSPATLFDLYCKSVGRGASLILNVPPDRKGQIDEPDVKSLKVFGQMLHKTFEHNFAEHAHVVPTNVRGNDARYGGQHLLSSEMDHYWATDDETSNPWIEIDLPSKKTFDLIRLREPIQLGQRVQQFAFDAFEDGDWTEVTQATSIGSCRLIRLNSPITTDRVRIRILKCPVSTLLYDFGLFKVAS